MKIMGSCGVRRLVVASALSIGLGLVTQAQAVDHSYLIDLNSKTVTGLGDVEAKAINDSGRVVGLFYTATDQFHAFITGPNGVGMTELGGNGSVATAINASGQVTGGRGTGVAFITGPNGVGLTDLDTPRGSYSGAYGINAAGQVVGYSGTPTTGQTYAFITGPNGVGMTNLDIPRGSYGVPVGINAAGQVVGYSGTPTGQTHAFITGPNGVGMTDLGTLGGSYSSATGINDAGQVVGWADAVNSSYGQWHAFITGPNGVGMSDIGTLSGDRQSAAFGINAAGQVVGEYKTATGQEHAFVTGPNGVGMTDLNSLVDLPAGVVLTSAFAINNMGQIIAMVPEPESYALMLAGLALMGVMVRRKQKG